MTYTYSSSIVGDQLSSISGTYNGIYKSGNFSYDGNGNATRDGLRGLTVTYFDELNLPKQYYQNSTNKVDYTYDAGGTKWSKTATVSGTASTTLYDGTFIYENGTLKKVLTSEGYYDPSAGLYYYYLKDHLGNTRLTFHYSGTTAVVDQEVEYYPFGSLFTGNNLDKNKYLYNGKELNDEFFENYDYGARFYDAELGRFHTQDAFAEKYYDFSPYQYGANNPILYLDVNGDSIDVSNLTDEQLKKYNSQIELLMESRMFSAYYSILQKSKTIYSVSAQKGEEGTDSEEGHFFNPNNNEVGVGENIDAYAVAQELFHAYQSDGNFYSGDKPKPLSSIEAEGDIATIYVMTEASLAYPNYGNWSHDFQVDAYDGIPSISKVMSSEYQQMFQTAADNRIDYYKSKSTKMNVPHSYLTPNTGVRPKALEAVIRLIKRIK